MSEADYDPHHGIPLANNADDPLEGVSDPPSSSLSPQEMHFPGVDDEPAPRRPLPAPMPVTKYKSWKKKYNKLRHQFKDVMGRSNRLFEEEQKLERVARRLKEENDQLLELLLDVNECKRLDPSLHYDLRSPTPSETAVPALESDSSSPSRPRPTYDLAHARAMLAEAHADLAAGDHTIGDHRSILSRIRASVGPAKHLALLEQTPHSSLAGLGPGDLPEELHDERFLGYLTAAHEDDYLAALDAGLDPSLLPLEPSGGGGGARAPERGNPASTYNWLRRNNPEVFSDGGEGRAGGSGGGATEAAPPAAGASGRRDAGAARKDGRAKRTSAVNTQELLDDIGDVIGEPRTDQARGNGRGKRKRDDEPYRPKGGSGSRARRKPSESGRPQSARKAFVD